MLNYYSKVLRFDELLNRNADTTKSKANNAFKTNIPITPGLSSRLELQKTSIKKGISI